MLQLKGALWHIVALAPLLNASDVVVDLQTTLPREEVSPHEKIVECRDTNKAQQLGHRLGDNRILQEVGLHGLENIVQKAQEVVHAESWSRVCLEQLAQESVALIGNKPRK